MSKLLLIKAKGTLPIMICFALAVVITGCDNVRQRQSVPTKNAASAVKTETPNRPQNEVEKKQADPLLKSQVKSRIEKIYSDIFSLGPSKRLELEDKYGLRA